MSEAARAKVEEYMQHDIECDAVQGPDIYGKSVPCSCGRDSALDAFAAERERAVWEEAAKIVEEHAKRSADCAPLLRDVAAALRARAEAT